MIFLIVKNVFYNNTFTQPGTEFSLESLQPLDGMNTYLLLRSNKQTGPYSLQQLVNFGLKPYDLVWEEGRSAAWRYPSEIDGLKAYAPAIEEQPFDRFYKKQEEKPQENPAKKQEQKQEETYILPTQAIHTAPIENKTVTTSKKIFVAMPENHVPKKQTEPVFAKAPSIVEEKPAPIEEEKIEHKPIYTRNEILAKEPPALKQEPIIKANPVSFNDEPTLDEKYSESLEDIKRRYTETYLNRKKRSKWTSTHTSIVQVVGGAVVFCFLVVVAYKNFAGEDASQSRITNIQPDKRSINTGTTTNTSATAPLIAPETTIPTAKKTHSVKEDKNIPAESLVINSAQQKNNEVTRNEVPANNDLAIVEKKAIMPKATEEKKEEIKPKTRPVNINKLVNVRANNYKQRAFGGIMNLELTVNNDSKFELDKVVVELEYLKPSEQPIKTEKIVFSSIEANGSKTLKIPDYLRGVKIAFRVTEIESSQYEKQTTAGL